MKNNLAVIESDSVIASMTRASFALAEAVTVSQTKTIIDVARAAEIYAKRQHLSESAISQATSVKVEAMRKLGEILKATPKAKTRMNGKNFDGTKKEPSKNDAPTLEELGLSKKESAVAQQLASLSEEAFEQVREGSVTIAKALAAVKADKEASKPTPVAPPPPPAPVVEPDSEAPPDYTELDAAHDQISGLQDALAVATMGDVSDEDKTQAATLIAELRARIKTLEAMNKQLTISRDGFQNQVAEMQKQITRQRKEIDKATGRRTA